MKAGNADETGRELSQQDAIVRGDARPQRSSPRKMAG